MIINERKGNLFELDRKYTLVHCISEDCKMGAGIATQFDKKFKNMKTELLETIKINNLSFPITLHYTGRKQNVLNLITKKVYYGKPTYKTITECIKQMKWYIEEYNIRYLAMPKIGCGLDKLQWGKVRSILEEELKDIDVEIEVRYL